LSSVSPCNQFGSQEPGSESEIKQFCSTKYSVSFPMFSKIEVNGDGADPLYKYLTSKDAKPAGKGDISWNFEKFLIDREGNLINRFAPRTKPFRRRIGQSGRKRIGEVAIAALVHSEAVLVLSRSRRCS